jgi:hypothetical protein
LRPGVFYGSNENSSDGLGYDTIKLIPDAALDFDAEYTNDQYIIIEPTGGEPGHVHIRSGGPIDQSEADLFLGGELNHVKVSDTNDTVIISTDAGGEGATREWTFSPSGYLQFPGGSNGRIGEDEPGLVVYSDLSFGILTNLANTENSRAWIFTNDNRLILPSNSAITSPGEMRFRTTRAGFDIDTDFDVEAADDVWIDALGNDARLAAANVVRIRSGTLNMYPTNWLGQGEEADFTGTWDTNTLTIVVPNGFADLITLLDHYTTSDAPIWIKTASGYAETENSDTATKTVGESTTTFEIPTLATSPAENATVLRLKLYDSINSLGEGGHTWTFEKNGKLSFPNGGAIEPVGMGWMGVTNGTTGTPISIVNKNSDGYNRADITLTNSGTSGVAQIGTINAPGIPNTGNYDIVFSSGNWDANPLTGLATTGGSGNGLTVNVNESGSGYADSVTVVNPGSEYLDGETINVTSGSSSATFVISVTEYTNNWSFDEDGALTFPDTTIQTTAFTTSPTLNVLKIDDGVHEKFQELADATGTVTHDCSSGQIFYHSSPDANWTVNLTNLNLGVGYATTVTLVIDQSETGYYPNALQIGGSAQTINWQGNATPTPSASRQDVVSFSILAVTGGYIVFGQLTGF